MRTRRTALLLMSAAAASLLLAANGAWASARPVPGAGYVWAQPDASLVGVKTAEPKSAVSPVVLMRPITAYVWAQPGASLSGVTSTQPVA